MGTQMKQRRGTASEWTSANPILGEGEIGYALDTGDMRIGDGINHWLDLPDFQGAPGAPGAPGSNALPMTTVSGVIPANINTGVSGAYATVLTTDILSEGVWLLHVNIAANPGSTAAVAMFFSAWAGLGGGSAIASFDGPNGTTLNNVAGSSIVLKGEIVCIVTVTTAGTILIRGYSNTAVAGTVASINGDSSKATGYVALKIG